MCKKIEKFFLLIIIFFSCSLNVKASPSIEAVGGSLKEDDIVSISGSQFGNIGPKIELFDDFEGVAGQEIPLTGASIGSWTNYGTYHPIYSSVANSGNTSMQIGDGNVMLQMQKQFPATTEVFASFWVRIPDGTNFPAAYHPSQYPGLPEWPSGRSSWKMLWFMDSATGYNRDDNIIFPSWTGSKWTVGSNNYQSVVRGVDGKYYRAIKSHIANETNKPVTGLNWNSYWQLVTNSETGQLWSSGTSYVVGTGWYPGLFANPDAWWTWNGWMRVSQWWKAGVNPTVDPGTSVLQVITKGVEQKFYQGPTISMSTNQSTPLFPAGLGNGLPQYDRLTFPGWMDMSGGGITPVYDDFYLSTGIGAQARVEIGDESTYLGSKNITILPVQKWSENSIDVKIKKGNFNDGRVYLYVTDKDGNVNANGYEIFLGSNVTADTTAPNVPIGLTVQ